MTSDGHGTKSLTWRVSPPATSTCVLYSFSLDGSASALTTRATCISQPQFSYIAKPAPNLSVCLNGHQQTKCTCSIALPNRSSVVSTAGGAACFFSFFSFLDLGGASGAVADAVTAAGAALAAADTGAGALSAAVEQQCAP